MASWYFSPHLVCSAPRINLCIAAWTFNSTLKLLHLLLGKCGSLAAFKLFHMDPIRARPTSSYAYFLSYRQGVRERTLLERASSQQQQQQHMLQVECSFAEMILSIGAPPSSVKKHPQAGHDKTWSESEHCLLADGITEDRCGSDESDALQGVEKYKLSETWWATRRRNEVVVWGLYGDVRQPRGRVQSGCRVHLADVPGQRPSWGRFQGEHFKVIV